MYPRLRFYLVMICLAVSPLSSLQAALLVYEGFNGYGTGTLNTKTPNANTIGLNTSTAYSGTGSDQFSLSATGITFSNLTTSGGSITSLSGATSVGAIPISLSGAHTGTLYASYLINIATTNSANGNGAQIRVANNNSNTNERFRAEADTRNDGGGSLVGAAYDSTAVTGTTGLATNTDYLVIGRWTNVGEVLSGGSPGVGTMYVLTAAQFNSFVAAGRTDAYLDGASLGTGASEITARVGDASTSGTFSFSTGSFVQFVSVNTAARYDELRYGTALADVTPVPEPAALGIGIVGAVILFAIMRRRRVRPAI